MPTYTANLADNDTQQASGPINQNGEFASSGPKRLEVTYVTTELPYPISHGGVMATHSAIQAIAALSSVSVVVLTQTRYNEATIRAAKKYYGNFCRSLVCHHFANLFPSQSRLVKAWHYLSGYPRHGYWSEAAEKFLAEEIGKTNCQVLWCGSTFEAKYLRVGRRMKCRTVLMTHNVESDLGRQEANSKTGIERLIGWVRWWDLRRLEKKGARCADVITGITTADVDYYLRLKNSDRVFLLPFGYSALHKGWNLDESREEPNTVCFIGSMDWPPNIKAARHLIEEVMPLVWKTIPETKCFLIGKNPTQAVLNLASSKVSVTGKVPSVRGYYEQAAVVVVPIQEVGGVKIKSVEAMAAGKALVSTSAGVTGLKVEHGKHLKIADTSQEFANAIIELLRDRPTRRRLGEEAQRFVIEYLSPREVERQVEKILDCLQRL